MVKTKNVVVICGPTASGKTGLALQLAKELPKANILSVDSRQVYKGLDLVTGKDIPHDLPPNIKLFGLDLYEPTEKANLADFVRYSDTVLHDSLQSNTPLIIVGGTGLYLKGIIEHPKEIMVPPNENLRLQIAKLSLEELQSILKKIAPQKYSSLNRSDSMNPRRLIRYIEIVSTPIKPSIKKEKTPVNFILVGLLPDKKTIKEQIRVRVLKRLSSGAINEVKGLINKYSDKNLPIYTSLGVSQIREFLDQKISQEQLIDIWTNAEVDYARRQIVWFKKQTNIVWYDKSIGREQLISKLKKIYQQND